MLPHVKTTSKLSSFGVLIDSIYVLIIILNPIHSLFFSFLFKMLFISQTLRTKFCLPASAYFVFLQLRSALKAYGVPWASSISSHPMRDWIAPSAGRSSVSLIYTKIIDCITKPLSIKTIWNRELSDLNLSVNWERVWSNLSLTSKNLAHRLIHFKVIHRAYITPYKRFKMKLQSNLNCHICNTTSSGTFLHMFWECPVVISLWTHVNLVLSSLLWIDWSVNPSLCLNDDSGLCISSMQKRMLFAGFTAAKKTIIQNWFTPHMCRKTYPFLPPFWLDFELSICLLFCFVIFWMLCYVMCEKKIKMLITKKKSCSFLYCLFMKLTHSKVF